MSIILTTHYLNEAQEMCDRIAIIDKGELVALDTTKNLISRIQRKKIILTLNKNILITDGELDSFKVLSNISNELIFTYEKSKLNIDQIISYINKKNVKILDMSTDDGDLEDVFVTLTNN